VTAAAGMARLDGRVALVTGAASGLGRAIAALFAAEGARVVAADVKEAEGRQAVEAIGEEAVFEPLDVTDEGHWSRVVDATLVRFGKLDVVVNNAGVAILKTVEETTLEEWRRLLAVNLDGVFLGCKHGIRGIRAGGRGGSIVNMSSVSGLVGGHNLAAYNASKGGVRLLTKSVALHCAREGYGIRCNSVHPTFVETPMVAAMIDGAGDPEKVRTRLERQIPLGRLGQPADVASAVLYLASDESRFMTGSEVVVDGGVTAQ